MIGGTDVNGSGEKGYTLVETLASFAIVMILILPLTGYFTNGYRNVHQEGQKTQVTAEAERAMETLYAWMAQQQAQGTLAKNGQDVTVDPTVLQFQPTTGVSTAISYQFESNLQGWRTQVISRWKPNGSQQERTYILTSFFGDYSHAKQ